jgi:hypothetical protein
MPQSSKFNTLKTHKNLTFMPKFHILKFSEKTKLRHMKKTTRRAREEIRRNFSFPPSKHNFISRLFMQMYITHLASVIFMR